MRKLAQSRSVSVRLAERSDLLAIRSDALQDLTPFCPISSLSGGTMATYYIHMDQGIVADLHNDTLCSGQFSSCAPIVLYNANTHICGLYHLGGCSRLNDLKIGHLNELITLVNPTVVYVLTGGGDFDMATGGMNYSQGHVTPVSNLFQNVTVHHDFNGRSTYNAITVSGNGGNLHIGNQLDTYTQLNSKEKIDGLPNHIQFIGERGDSALSMWL